MASSKYATATSLRTALESRLQQTARKERIDLQRLQRQVAFDRLLARFFTKDTIAGSKFAQFSSGKLFFLGEFKKGKGMQGLCLEISQLSYTNSLHF